MSGAAFFFISLACTTSFGIGVAYGSRNVNEAAIKAVVGEQADDDGLWFHAETAAEAYVQQALRRLHAVIEGKTPEQCAIETLSK